MVLLQDILEKFSQKILTLCPGIRFRSNKDSNKNLNKDDQKRIMTPEAAFANGADYIVMGRSITQAESPESLLQELNLL